MFYVFLIDYCEGIIIVNKVNTTMGSIKLPMNKVTPWYYNPKNVDWAGVISGCRAACNYEKRLCNFYIRAAAHDSMSVSDGIGGGADGSLLLSDDELRRVENNHDNFAYLVSKNALTLARRYKASVADIIAVCGAVATQYLGGPRIIRHMVEHPFLVGRLDTKIPNPAKSLAPANMNTSSFVAFAKLRGLSVDEMTALMGSHVLLDTKACIRPDGTYCDPNKEPCDKVGMFTWDNSYYSDVCNTPTTIYSNSIEQTINISRTFLVNEELCKYTSDVFRDKVKEDVVAEIPEEEADPAGMIEEKIFTMIETVKTNFMGLKTWLFTVHDGWMGKTCRNELKSTAYDRDIGVKMRKFKNNRTEWDISYARGYKKMINIGVSWSRNLGYPITGFECNSGYISNNKEDNCSLCNANYQNIEKRKCPSGCYCKTSFGPNDKFYY